MILTSLVGLALGILGTGANGNVYYNNYISMSSDLVTVAVAKNTSTYSALQVKCDVSANCDFRESTNEQGIKEYWVHFNSWEIDLKAYNSSSDSFTSIAHSTNYYNYFESSVVNDSNNFLEMYFTFSQSTNNGTLSFFTSWYDYALDENSGISVSNSSPLYGSSNFVAFPNTYSIRFDLDVLHKQLVNAFNMGIGGYQTGYDDGFNAGNAEGYDTGYGVGYADGYTEGVETNGTAFTIFNGIIGIGMLPINVFLAMLDWQVFGINISNFVMSILTLAITIYVISTFTGKKEKK